MPLSWNEIRNRALAFSSEWASETSEDAEAKTFWDAFFNVFGIPRRRVASFETPVHKSDGHGGFIDLLWKGVLLVEHKSRGKDLERATRQAFDYFSGLKDRDLPRYVIVSDFSRIRLYDLDEDTRHEFALADLHCNIRLFGFMLGYETRNFGGETDPVNIRAAEKLGALHDQLLASGYGGHDLELLLVRLLFCLFADDTGIFTLRGQFQHYLERRTGEDGSDLGMHLTHCFQVLNTPLHRRQANLDEDLASFPYINGHLFDAVLPIAAFNAAMRESLLECCALDWGRISPAIFGSLFQSIMDKTARRNLGAHYTTEANILKALRPLFLDALHAEFETLRRKPRALQRFHEKLAAIRVLDPACGCGNFLVIAYRELRLLELQVLQALHKNQQNRVLDVGSLLRLNVDRFYGIEIEDFPAQIAQVALWLTDHQMNLRVSETFGQYFARLPLTTAPHIVHGNALALDWADIVAPQELSYIVGNPPFVGKKEQSSRQKEELLGVARNVPGAGLLDYVAAWYIKAAHIMEMNVKIKSAFVSTNSITHGEQVGVLWPYMAGKGAQINFAHRTFRWSSEAKGKAAVHCVIVGFSLDGSLQKTIYEYPDVEGQPQEISAAHINPYLADAPDVFLSRRNSPLGEVPCLVEGITPLDNGILVFSGEERDEFLLKEPAATKWFRRWLTGNDFINGEFNYCLWLSEAAPGELRSMPHVMGLLEKVRNFRLSSKSSQKFATTPWLFRETAIPFRYLFIPKTSSEKREILPIGFVEGAIATNSALYIGNATLYHFGVLTSAMHMAWTRTVCGRLESRYRYSAGIVYNNFPWPEASDAQRRRIEVAAQAVLDARARFPDATLADLYDPLAMPPGLRRAHAALDKAVDAAYGKTTFATEAARVAFLFERYQRLTASLLPAAAPLKRGRKRI